MVSSKIFRSRWSALIWAAGILWTAYDVAEASAPPKPPAHHKTDARQSGMTSAAESETGVSDQDLKILADFANGQ